MVKVWLCSIPRNTCIACSYLLLLWLPSQPFFLQIFSSEVVWLKRLGRPWSWELVLSHLSFCFQLSCKTNIKVLLIGNVNDKSWPWVWFRIFISVVSFYINGCTYNCIDIRPILTFETRTRISLLQSHISYNLNYCKLHARPDEENITRSFDNEFLPL